MSGFSITCPTNCTNMVLPIVSFDKCAPNVSFGEIEHIYVAMGDAPAFADWTSLNEWSERLSQTVENDVTKIRDFYVIADLPAATADEIVISLGRKIYSPASHVINVEIDDVSDENYDFMLATSCNVRFKVWFATESYLYGGYEGILANINLRPVIERGQKSVNKLAGTITWEAALSPERTENPLGSLYE